MSSDPDRQRPQTAAADSGDRHGPVPSPCPHSPTALREPNVYDWATSRHWQGVCVFEVGDAARGPGRSAASAEAGPQTLEGAELAVYHPGTLAADRSLRESEGGAIEYPSVGRSGMRLSAPADHKTMKHAHLVIPGAIAGASLLAFGASAGPVLVLAPAAAIFFGTLSIRKAPPPAAPSKARA